MGAKLPVLFTFLFSLLLLPCQAGAQNQWGRVVRCESADEHYHFCSTGPIRGAALRRQISGSPCTEERTWGRRGDGIWVDRGCRGDFEVFRQPEAKIIRCDSDDEGYHVCQTGPIHRAELARQISGSPCREGHGWGYRPDGVWVDHGCRAEFRVYARGESEPAPNVVRCSSDDEHYRFCQTGPIGRAELNRQLSGSPCREGQSWGRRPDGLWVDHGCRADFVVYAARPLVSRTVRCDSNDQGYRLCSTGPIERAELARQISGSPCRETYSWGAQRDGIWVDHGCRAEFTVYSFEDAKVPWEGR